MKVLITGATGFVGKYILKELAYRGHEIVIVSTNRGEPLVLNQDFSLAKLAFENTSRRLVGETVAFVDFDRTYRLHFNRIKNFFSTIK